MNRLVCAVVVFSLLVFSSISLAQSKLTPAGRWEGSIVAPSGELKVVVDLDRDSDGAWIGDIDIPQQGVADLPLKNVSVSNNAVMFELPAGPGGPRFQGKLSEDGNTLAGEFTQAGSSFPLSMKRAGEAKVRAAKNLALPEKFIGKWEGKLETPGGALRLIFNLSNKHESADGTIDSPDQGATGIPISEISTAESSVKITVKVIGASYAGKLSGDETTLTGDWSQGGGSLPLTLKKASPAKK